MNITVTTDKIEKIKRLYEKSLNKVTITIRDLAKLIGNLVATFEAVSMGLSYYCSLETDKISALAQSPGDFDANIRLSDASLNETPLPTKCLTTLPIDLNIHTDASKLGWGANDSSVRIKDRWTDIEAELRTY